jgi:hypothetical protein
MDSCWWCFCFIARVGGDVSINVRGRINSQHGLTEA